MADQRETCYDFIAGNKTATISTSEQKWINKLKRLQSTHPDKVHIIAENQDGSIMAHIPSSWFKISPPRKVSDEQRQKASERFKAMWNDSKTKQEINNI